MTCFNLEFITIIVSCVYQLEVYSETLKGDVYQLEVYSETLKGGVYQLEVYSETQKGYVYQLEVHSKTLRYLVKTSLSFKVTVSGSDADRCRDARQSRFGMASQMRRQ